MKPLSAVGDNLGQIWQPTAWPRSASKPGIDTPQSRSDFNQDVFCLSPLAASVAAGGLDTTCSYVRQAELNTQLEFSLAFASRHVSQLRAEGIYMTDRQEMRLSLSFTFERQLVVDGRTQRSTYQVQLDLCASNVRTMSLEAFEEKEDIGQLVRRLVDDIIETACKENTRLSGVIIDHQDLLELASRDRGRILEALITLIQTVIDYTHTFKTMREGRAIQDVILTPQRQKISGIKVHQEAIHLTDFSLTLSQLDTAEMQSATQVQRLPSEPTGEKGSNASRPQASAGRCAPHLQ